MTHFGVLVLTDGHDAVDEAVSRLLAPYNENDEWFREGSKLDWYVVGGRWTGALDGYDPTKDPANQEPCEFCEGTGTTTQAVADRYPAYEAHVGKTCFQCKGTGKSVKWHLEPHDGDVVPVARVDRAKAVENFAVVVTPDGEWHGGTFGWFGSVTEAKAESDAAWAAKVNELLDAHPTATAVVVDAHV